MNNLNITIGFSTTNKIISRLIRFFINSKVSHAWIAFDDSCLKMRMVMQAEAWGFEIRPLKRWQKENILIDEFVPIGNDLKDSFYYMAEKLGTKYDYKNAFLMGIWSWLKIKLIKPLESPDKLSCSESVVDMLQHAKYKVTENLNDEIITPGELLKLISKSNEFINVAYNK